MTFNRAAYLNLLWVDEIVPEPDQEAGEGLPACTHLLPALCSSHAALHRQQQRLHAPNKKGGFLGPLGASFAKAIALQQQQHA